jgi:hypothetical protein
MIPVFDYRIRKDKTRDSNALKDFINYVVDHGFGILQLFNEETISRIEKSCDIDLFLSSGAKYEDIINGVEEKRNQSLKCIGGVRKRSASSHIFYTKGIFDVCISKTMQYIFDTLYDSTYKSSNPLYKTPFKIEGNSLPFLDRYGFRLPSWIPSVTFDDGTTVGPEEGLGLHVDMDPYNPYLHDETNISQLIKWRPFQSFVTISDHSMENNGGICVIPDFHKRFCDFFKSYSRGMKIVERTTTHSGEFFRMGECDGTVGMECVPVLAPPGSLILWDSRLPHKTTKTCDNPLGRKQIYGSWIPNCELNRKLAELEKKHFQRGILPQQELSIVKCYKAPDLVLNNFQKNFFD